MVNPYDQNEENISQKPALEVLNKLGYEIISPVDAEKMRRNFHNVLLTPILRKQIEMLNSFEYKGKKYKFEALGNKSKVKIISGGNSFRFGNDFVMFDKDFKMPEIVIPDFDFKMPDIKIPEFNFDFDNIVIPEIDMDKILLDIEDIDFDWDKYSKDGKKLYSASSDGKLLVWDMEDPNFGLLAP